MSNTHKFTLIEMLVVMAIIGILASLLMPSLRSALESGRELSCSSNLRNTGVIAASYVSDYNALLPAAFSGLDFPHSAYAYATFPGMMAGYAAGLPIHQWGFNQPIQSFSGIFACPSDRNIEHFPLWKPSTGTGSFDPRSRLGYTVNTFAWICLNDRNIRYSGTEGARRQLRMAEIRKPGMTALYGDGMTAFCDNTWLTVSSGGISIPDYIQTGSGNVKWSNWSGLRLGHRNNNGYNLLFFDGHAAGHSAPYYPPSLGTSWLNDN